MAGPHPDAACRSGQRKRWHDNGGRYALVDGDGSLSSAELIERWAALADRYPIWSLEDGLGEDDSDGWVALTAPSR